MLVQWVMDNLFLQVIEHMQLTMMGMGMQIYLVIDDGKYSQLLIYHGWKKKAK